MSFVCFLVKIVLPCVKDSIKSEEKPKNGKELRGIEERNEILEPSLIPVCDRFIAFI